MFKKVICSIFLLLSVLHFSQEKEIAAVMKAQSTAWNKGELEGYMQGYWKNEKMMFIGKNGPTYGWQKTLENYKKSYPTKEKMGNLYFSDLKIDMLGKKYAHVFGRWKLERKEDTLGGIYTLVFQKFGKDWKIISDHTQ